MAATVDVTRFYGAGPSQQNSVATLVMKWADDNTDDANDPIVRGASTVYAWAKSLMLRFTSLPAGSITNLRFFSAAVNFGGSWTGISMLAQSFAAYTIGSAADQTSARAGMSNRLSGSPLVVNAGTVIDSGGSVPGFGTQDYTVLQVSVSNSVPAGASASQTQTFRYAET